MRMNKNILVLPYKINKQNGEATFCVMKRSDIKDCWQFVAGGVEEKETITEAAKRELFEETGISEYIRFALLDSICSVPGYFFKKDFKITWPSTVYVVQCNAFGVEINSEKIILSKEHLDFKWLSYDSAYELLQFDFDRTALWELNQRIKDNVFNEPVL